MTRNNNGKSIPDFDDFSPNMNQKNRLLERHRRIIVQNYEFIEEKRILDLACNNARWIYAACEAGAASVVGVEGRRDKVIEGQGLINRMGYADRCSIQQGDIFDYLYNVKKRSYDTIFCLGIYYHIMDHYMLLKLMAKAEPKAIIIDSGFLRSFSMGVWVQSENPSLHRNALPAFAGQKREIVSTVTLGLMNQMAWNCGYRCEPILWDPKEVQDAESVHDYLIGRRYTLRLTKMSGFDDKHWKELWRKPLKQLNPRFELLLDDKKAHLAVDDRCKNPLAI